MASSARYASVALSRCAWAVLRWQLENQTKCSIDYNNGIYLARTYIDAIELIIFLIVSFASFCCRAQCSVPLAQRSKCFPHQHAHHVQLLLVTPRLTGVLLVAYLQSDRNRPQPKKSITSVSQLSVCILQLVATLCCSIQMACFLLQHNIGQLFQPEIAYRDLLACCEACHACLREGSPIKCKSVPLIIAALR